MGSFKKWLPVMLPEVIQTLVEVNRRSRGLLGCASLLRTIQDAFMHRSDPQYVASAGDKQDNLFCSAFLRILLSNEG
ncbi:hypothetical protein TNCV_1014111 [Trichonephila clavipes]|uniref:Uncharacterized protein n=1 Tax=Trichonephila clavipes TaxID=2585209 RepID=A0A8X7BB90_TRICX|nr:hypothetical protein TNCV_1014111 [Trichonephila clavipes]